ncbi:MAG: arylesterase [Brachymonas sp.]|nr:arylesterase [Brachymonas sp.]
MQHEATNWLLGVTTRRGLARLLLPLCLIAVPLAGHAQATKTAAKPSAKAAAKPVPRILVVGDSISSEYGLPRGSGWVALLQKRLDTGKQKAEVINASISGDTTSGGRSRLPQLLSKHQPQVVVLELGGNDALRGLSLQQTRDNLKAMTVAAQKARAKVLLVGMQVPPNYGPQYTADFAKAFVDVSQAHKVPLVPFLLKGVGDVPDSQRWFQADRIHPNAQAQGKLLDNVWPQLQRLLR